MPRGRRDANEPEAISVLQQAGFEVHQLEDKDRAGLPDLVAIGPMRCPHCAARFEQARLIEIKTARGRIRPEQAEMLARHPLAARLARTPVETLAAVDLAAQVINVHERRVAQARRQGGK
jgi:uncharacterized protein (UPF0212 family)